MYNFFYNLWIMNKISEEKLENAVVKGLLTSEEKRKIVETLKFNE